MKARRDVPEARGTKKRLTVIDALRGIAACWVILPHFCGFFAVLAQRGRISYSIYLVHVPVGFLFLGVKNRLFRDGLAADSAAFLLAVLFTFLLAEIFYQVAERPAMRLSQRFRPI